MERDSFVFYRGFFEALSDLDDADRLATYDAICQYALNGTEPAISGAVSAMLKMAKPQIDANNRKYENGKQGGRPANQKKTYAEPKNNQKETKQKPNKNHEKTKDEPNSEKAKPNVNVNVNENVNENDINSSAPKKAPAAVEAVILSDGSEWRPTQELYEEYCRLFPSVDVKAQFRSMRAWCLSNPKQRKTPAGVSRFVRSWLQREQDSPRQAARKPAQKPTQYDIGALEDALLWR